MAKPKDWPALGPLEVGAVYINSGAMSGTDGYMARKILCLRGSEVVYADFTWPEGESLDPAGMCLRGTFTRWCYRRLTDDEAKSLPSTEKLQERMISHMQWNSPVALRRLFKKFIEHVNQRDAISLTTLHFSPEELAVLKRLQTESVEEEDDDEDDDADVSG